MKWVGSDNAIASGIDNNLSAVVGDVEKWEARRFLNWRSVTLKTNSALYTHDTVFDPTSKFSLKYSTYRIGRSVLFRLQRAFART